MQIKGTLLTGLSANLLIKVPRFFPDLHSFSPDQICNIDDVCICLNMGQEWNDWANLALSPVHILLFAGHIRADGP